MFHPRTSVSLLLGCFIVLVLLGCYQSPPFVYVGGDPEPDMPGEDHPCVNFDDSNNPELTIAEAVATRSDARLFTEWLQILKQGDPDSYNNLDGNGFRSLLVPSNSAIERFQNEMDLSVLTEDQWLTLIKHHILIIPVYYEQFEGSGAEAGMNREPVEYHVEDTYCVIFEDRGKLIEADDKCENGVIHMIDQVLIPSRGF